jgi:4-hydroxy-3-polyprenylbenzoate decarboxylase
MNLRAFIDLLSTQGYLQRIEREVDWKFEIGSITRQHRVPLLFENVKGYPGRRVFTNGLSNVGLIALALGLDPKQDPRVIIREARTRLQNPLAPTIVESGPVSEIVVPAPDIDFLTFPIPQWSTQDAGRYLGTWHINVTKDPETGTRNVGVYRMQVLGPRHATVSTSPTSDLGRHVTKAEKAGRSLQMAVAIGVNEAVMIAGSAACPYGFDEYEFAGGLQTKPLQLLKCQSVDLEVPADSEIAIEGFIKPGERVQDGPYLDYAGKANTNHNAFLFEATRLMFRNNPIFRGTSVGLPGAEDHQVFSLLAHLNLVDFHGRRSRQRIQNPLLKKRLFKAFQFAGRLGGLHPRNWGA